MAYPQKVVLTFRCFGCVLLATSVFLFGTSASAQLSDAVQTVSVNGMEMYYETHGEGEPLVLLHGITGTGAIWAPFLEELSRDHQVIVPDLRGHGRATSPSNEFTHKQAASDVFVLLDHLAVDHFQAMGISSGGMTLLIWLPASRSAWRPWC